jgi:hypothetical protein
LIANKKGIVMATQTQPNVGHLFDQAFQAFNETLRSGVKIQEDVGRWWTDAFDQALPKNDWQKKTTTLVGEVIPVAQRSAEEWLKVLEANYRRTTVLLKNAFDVEPAETADLRARTEQLWRESFELVKQNAEAVAQANLKLIELWSGVLKRNVGNGKAAKK